LAIGVGCKTDFGSITDGRHALVANCPLVQHCIEPRFPKKMMGRLLSVSGAKKLVVTPSELGICVIPYDWSHELEGDDWGKMRTSLGWNNINS
jgi:hypothetical protein